MVVAVDYLTKKERLIFTCSCIIERAFDNLMKKEWFHTLSLTLHDGNCIIYEVRNIYLSYMR